MASVRSLVLELRMASRGLWREPGLVLTVTLILGASIGACIIAFAVWNALFLRPLAVREPERLVVLWEEDLERDRHLFEVSFKNFLEWKAASTSFENMAAMGFHDWGMVLWGEGEPERLPYRAVAASFFDTLGARDGQILRLVVGRALRWAGIGLAVGVAIAWPAVGFLSSLLFKVEATDPLVFSAMGALVLAVSLLASWIPARRAAAMDPAAILRGD